MKVLGLTGSICAGKSTICEYLKKKRSAYVFDCDAECHSVLDSCPDEVDEAIGFKLNIADRRMRRAVIAELIFADAKKKERLEKLVWSRLEIKLQKELELHRRGLFVIDAPVLFQAGFDKYADKVIFVDADTDLRRQRFISRGSGSADDFNARDENQKRYFDSNRDGLAGAVVIMNNGTVADMAATLDNFSYVS